MNPKTSPYDDYAAEYSAYVAQREWGGVEGDPMGILPHLLTLLGNVAGCTVLDGGCGEAYLARILAAHGARVTGIDRAQPLIDLARATAHTAVRHYAVAGMSVSVPPDAEAFAAVA